MRGVQHGIQTSSVQERREGELGEVFCEDGLFIGTSYIDYVNNLSFLCTIIMFKKKFMYSANDITDYVILKLTQEDTPSLINLKLQKLLYYIQAWHLGIYGKPFLQGEFQAWAHGPVHVETYNRFKESKNLYSFILASDIINQTPTIKDKDKEYINWILENYAPYSGVQLERMTHVEDPWCIARKGIGQYDKCTNVISEESMIKYYGERWAKLNKD